MITQGRILPAIPITLDPGAFVMIRSASFFGLAEHCLPSFDQALFTHQPL
jgi:hypothetical protein